MDLEHLSIGCLNAITSILTLILFSLQLDTTYTGDANYITLIKFVPESTVTFVESFGFTLSVLRLLLSMFTIVANSPIYKIIGGNEDYIPVWTKFNDKIDGIAGFILFTLIGFYAGDDDTLAIICSVLVAVGLAVSSLREYSADITSKSTIGGNALSFILFLSAIVKGLAHATDASDTLDAAPLVIICLAATCQAVLLIASWLKSDFDKNGRFSEVASIVNFIAVGMFFLRADDKDRIPEILCAFAGYYVAKPVATPDSYQILGTELEDNTSTLSGKFRRALFLIIATLLGLAVIIVIPLVEVDFMGDIGTVWLLSTIAFIKTLSYCVNAVEAFMGSELTNLSVVHHGTTLFLLLSNSWSRPGFLSVLLFRYVDLLFAPPTIMSLFKTSFDKDKDKPTFDNYRFVCVLLQLIASCVLGFVGIDNVCPLGDLFNGYCPEIETVDEELAMIYIAFVSTHVLLGIITLFIGIFGDKDKIQWYHYIALNTIEIARLTVATVTITVGSMFLHSNQESVFALSLAFYACVDALGMFFM